MKLTTLKGALLIIKQTEHEADHPEGELWYLQSRRCMKLTTLKGSYGNYKADEAWS